MAGLAALLNVHRNTVRDWIKRGLPTCDDQRPVLIRVLISSHFSKRDVQKNRDLAHRGRFTVWMSDSTESGRRSGRVPAYDCDAGNLVGICPTCDAVIYRRVNRSKLELFAEG